MSGFSGAARVSARTLGRGRAAALVWIFSTAAVQASWVPDERSRWSLGAEAGRAWPAGSFADGYKAGALVGGRIKHDVTERWSVAGAFASQSHKPKDNLSERLVMQPVMAAGFYAPVRTAALTPYLTAAAGVSRNRRVVFAVDHTWTKLAFGAGAGLEFNVPPLATAGIEIMYRYFGRPSRAEKVVQAGTVSLVLGFYIPDSWIPEKPKKPLVSRPERRSPPDEAAPDTGSDPQSAQAELDRLKQEIANHQVPPIQFLGGTDQLLSSSHEALDMAGAVLMRYPALAFRIEVHTDESGEDLDKFALSQKRAEVVRDYLLKNFIVSPDKLVALGLGDTQPVADASTEEGRAANRRVEFVILR
jgi:outer membrane protein OmpA-like peptidoglycan-associated protein/opacity protein-like surface antigen